METIPSRSHFIEYICEQAGTNDPRIQNLLGALWDEEMTPADAPTPLDTHIRFQRGYRDWRKMAADLTRVCKGFLANDADFWHPIFYDLVRDVAENRTHPVSGKHFTKTQQTLAGGYIPDEEYTCDPPTDSPNYIEYQRIRDKLRDDDEIEQLDREFERLEADYNRRFAREMKKHDAYIEQLPLARATKRLIRLSAKLHGEELLKEFFAGTPFMELYPEPEPEPVEITPDLPFSGTWVLAAQGKGKTTLLSHIILERMQEPCSIVLFDSKPELALRLQEYQFPKPTVVIKPDPFLALNPLDLGTHNADILMYVFAALAEAKLTPNQDQVLRQALHLCTKLPNANLDALMNILIKGKQSHPELIASLHPREQDFWLNQYDKGYYSETRTALFARIDKLTPPDSVARSMFDAPRTRLRMAPLMDSNTLTIVESNLHDHGELLTEFFGRLVLALILSAAEQRARLPDHKKLPCYVVMDEAHIVVGKEPRVADIIYRCRSQKIGLLIANQALLQIKDPLVYSALNDCAIRYVNVQNDAPAVAQSMGVRAEDIRHMPIGTFALSLHGQPAQKVKIPLPQFTYPKATQSQLEARRAHFKQTYCYTPTMPTTMPTIVPPDIDDETGKPIL